MRVTSFFKFILTATIASFLTFSATSCSDDDGEIAKDNQKQIIEFTIDNVKAEIDEASKTITITLPASTDITKLKPQIKISDKATVSPASGIEIDFTNMVTYTITAEDNSTQAYTVNAHVKSFTYLITKSTALKDGSEYFSSVFEYDDKDKLINFKEGYISEYSENQSCDFIYNDKGELFKLIILEGNSEKEHTFNYVDATTVEVACIENGINQKDVFKLNDKGMIEKYHEDVEGINTWTQFEYDDKGNLLKVINKDNSYTQFTYDDKKGMLKDITLPQWALYYCLGTVSTPNNFISITHYMSDGNIDDGTQTYKYTYDEVGYPVSYIYEYGITLNQKIEYKVIEQ